MTSAADIEATLTPDIRDRLLSLPNVQDVSMALSTVAGRYTDRLAIVVYVRNKVAEAALPVEHRVPREIDGVRTDVQLDVDARHIKPAALLAADRMRVRPLTCGLSIGPDSNRIGTLGFYARRNSDSKPVLISNYHVLFWGRAVALPGMDHVVLQPPVGTNNRVGEVVGGNIGGSIDAAFAVLDEEGSSCCCKSVIPHANQIDSVPLTGVASARPDTTVYKVGRTSGRTVGRVVDTSKDITGAVDYSSFDLPAGSSFTFTDLIMVVTWDETAGTPDVAIPFMDEGDSGAPLFNENDEIIGLSMAAFHDPETNRHFSFACHIETVESALGITVPGNRTGIAAVGSTSSTALAALNPAIDPSVGTVTIGSLELPATAVETLLRDLETRARSTAAGHAWLALIEEHRYEILRLVNRHRPVTVAWHRGQGPAWLAALVRNAKRTEFALPDEIQGTTRHDLIDAMRRVLLDHGSEKLRADLMSGARVLDRILSTATSTREIADTLAATPIPSPVAIRS